MSQAANNRPAPSGEKLLPVHECFYSWQGEGTHLGRSAYFIRLFGCPVHCPWCDSAGTWHPDHVPDRIERHSAASLADAAQASGAEFVVVTGGEPTIHDLGPLTAALRERSIPAHLETSGAFEIRGEFDWVTVSPKWAKLPLPEVVRRADELKLIVEAADSIERWSETLGASAFPENRPVWLHPEWSQRRNRAVLDAITNCVKTCRAPFRAGYQMHKLFAADELDAGTRPEASLGGTMEF